MKRGQRSDWLRPNARNSNLTQHGAPINNEYDKLILTKMGLLLEWASYWNVASTGMGYQLEWSLHWNRASTVKGISIQTLFK